MNIGFIKMKRRSFIKKTAIAGAGIIGAPYIIPSGRLFASTGNRLVNHVVFVLFAGGLRNQESVDMQYLQDQNPLLPSGNVMPNILEGNTPSSNLVYTPWSPILSTPLSKHGTLFKELMYSQGPTGHYNGHTVAITGNYTETGLNLNINPDNPTVFEYYLKHNSPTQTSLKAWWLSEGLGPYPSLNFSQHPLYGPQYGANYMHPATIFNDGYDYLQKAINYQPDDVSRIQNIKNLLNNNFDKEATDLPGIINSDENKEQIKSFLLETIGKAKNGTIDLALPSGVNAGQLSGDLINISAAWQVLETFAPELIVVNTFNLDSCHNSFSNYFNFLHKADYGVGWLWNNIQNDPILANDTILICMPEHGRNSTPNSISDSNGLFAYDHTSDYNSRRMFALIAGPTGVVNQDLVIGSQSNPVGEAIDIVPTIAHILGYNDQIPAGYLPGNVLTQAFA
jgi:hypothetical protein